MIKMCIRDRDYDVDAFEDLIEIKGNDDHSKLIAMLDELNDYSIPITQIMDRWFCRENLLSWMAFHILMGNVDTCLLYTSRGIADRLCGMSRNTGGLRGRLCGAGK